MPILAMALSVVLLAGAVDTELAPSPLVGRWDATRLGRFDVPAKGHPSFMQFAANGTLTGVDGCNEVWGKYKVAGEVLTVTELAMTTMSCRRPRRNGAFQARQRLFGTLFSTSARFKLDRRGLTMTASDGVVGVFRRGVDSYPSPPSQGR
jgi:heat shock protein HslJ